MSTSALIFMAWLAVAASGLRRKHPAPVALAGMVIVAWLAFDTWRMHQCVERQRECVRSGRGGCAVCTQ